MVNPFILAPAGGTQDQPEKLILATVAGVYSDGLSLIPDDQAEATQKHYKYLASAYPAPAAGDRVVVMKMSGTYIVMGSLGESGPAPILPISKGGTGQAATTKTRDQTGIVTMETGFTLGEFSLTKWGNVVQVYFSVISNDGTSTGSRVVGTFSEAFCPMGHILLTPYTTSRVGYISQNGAISINGILAPSQEYFYSATYLLA